MTPTIPAGLKWLEGSPSGAVWLDELPARIAACAAKWGLSIGAPYEKCFVSLVMPATLPNGVRAVLKIQYPHNESAHEAEALRRWNGIGAVRLFDEDVEHHALLMEQCEPGDHLSSVGPNESLEILIALLPRLWIPAGEPFRTLDDESAGWLEELPASWQGAGRPFERELLDAALEAIDCLRHTQGEQVLVHQDLHGENVLRSTREPWLVIDPKPLVGERAFSLAPIVRSYEFGHSRELVIVRLDKLTSELGLNRERARLWTLAQTLAWAFSGSSAHARYVQTARWLWRA